MDDHEKRWIRCRVTPGMFSDERTIEIAGRSYFVDERWVRNVAADGAGEVEVTIVRDDGCEWVVLPTSDRESFVLGA